MGAGVKPERPQQTVVAPCGCATQHNFVQGQRYFKCGAHGKEWIVKVVVPRDVEYTVEPLHPEAEEGQQ